MIKWIKLLLLSALFPVWLPAMCAGCIWELIADAFQHGRGSWER